MSEAEILQLIAATLVEIRAAAQGIEALCGRGVFLLQAAAFTLGAIWGGLTWALILASKNEREFF